MGGETESMKSGRSRKSYKDLKDSRSIATIDPLASSVRDAHGSLDPIDEWDTHGDGEIRHEPRKIHLKVHLVLGIMHVVFGVIIFFFDIFSLVFPPRGGIILTGTGLWLGPVLVIIGIIFIMIRIKNTYSMAKIGFFAAIVACVLSFFGMIIVSVEVAMADITHKELRREWNLNRGKFCVSCTEYAISRAGITIFLLFVELVLFCVCAAVSYIDAGLTYCGKRTKNVKTVYVPQPVYVPVPVGSHVGTESVHSLPPSMVPSVHSVPPSRGTMSVISATSSRAGPPRPMSELVNESNGPPTGQATVFDHTRPGAVAVGSDRVSVRSGASSRR